MIHCGLSWFLGGKFLGFAKTTNMILAFLLLRNTSGASVVDVLAVFDTVFLPS